MNSATIVYAAQAGVFAYFAVLGIFIFMNDDGLP